MQAKINHESGSVTVTFTSESVDDDRVLANFRQRDIRYQMSVFMQGSCDFGSIELRLHPDKIDKQESPQQKLPTYTPCSCGANCQYANESEPCYGSVFCEAIGDRMAHCCLGHSFGKYTPHEEAKEIQL